MVSVTMVTKISSVPMVNVNLVTEVTNCLSVTMDAKLSSVPVVSNILIPKVTSVPIPITSVLCLVSFGLPRLPFSLVDIFPECSRSFPFRIFSMLFINPFS
jgi:hypothetical protein